MWLKWLPWRFIVRRIAKAHGFLDPIAVLAKLHRFAQPSEVAEPVELLRAGVVFHARGLINSRVIQHNMDWVWPYWVESQFDPKNDAFIPRAFSITHVNLTHRNWTAVGLPDRSELPIVDPRGLLTPFYDEWSLDGWLVTEDGRTLLPSRIATVDQTLTFRSSEGEGLCVTTASRAGDLSLLNETSVHEDKDGVLCRMNLTAQADSPAWLVVALRPYNPEGISMIHKAALASDRQGWWVDERRTVRFSAAADRHHVSDYRAGDVHIHLHDLADEHSGECNVGMVTAAALFKLQPGEQREISIEVPLLESSASAVSWDDSLSGCCQLEVPDEKFQFLYDAALRTLILHSPEDVYPGPFTYKRFWFRDAAFIIHGLLCAGLVSRAERALDQFPDRQTIAGYFHSQDGEWDSNGEALWIMRRFCELTGRQPKEDWRRAIFRGGQWIHNKRLVNEREALHAGLLPAGFSAEHLGPNDFYYWDDYWGIAGLQAAAWLAAAYGDEVLHNNFIREADLFREAVDHSLSRVAERLGRLAIPASPYRRLDAGMIGSVVAGYPLNLYPADDPRLLDTVDFLLNHTFVDGGFFQDMIHSGINAYLTLHVGQVLLRAGDERYFELMNTVAEIASPTGQWPEAIHPRTGGGCMGDGQHVWAAAEWVLMIRNCFVREEGQTLILASGIPKHWLRDGAKLAFGPAPTTFGTISLTIESKDNEVIVSWQGAWHTSPPPIEVRLPGHLPLLAGADRTSVEVKKDTV